MFTRGYIEEIRCVGILWPRRSAGASLSGAGGSWVSWVVVTSRDHGRKTWRFSMAGRSMKNGKLCENSRENTWEYMVQYPMNVVQYPMNVVQYPINVVKYHINVVRYPINVVKYPILMEVLLQNTSINGDISSKPCPKTPGVYPAVMGGF